MPKRKRFSPRGTTITTTTITTTITTTTITTTTTGEGILAAGPHLTTGAVTQSTPGVTNASTTVSTTVESSFVAVVCRKSN